MITLCLENYTPMDLLIIGAISFAILIISFILGYYIGLTKGRNEKIHF